MPDEEVIEQEDQDLLPAVIEQAPATLFRTDDPVEIIERATAVAQALSDVLKKQGLTTRIGQKDHVRVEGWTLCGSMLGVFPVVEWTRKIDNGWEARVEARTRDGAVVGAAEAICLSTENRWKTADDYAIKSMAQTRAVSKALRAPLGFVVALAGFDPTPAEEAHPPASAEPKPFDPETDLLPGAIQGREAPKQLAAALENIDPTIEWGELLASIVQQKWGMPSRRELEGTDLQDYWRRLSNAVQWISDKYDSGDFPPPEAATIQAGFAFAFSGIVVEVPYRDVVAVEAADEIEWPEPGGGAATYERPDE